MRGKVLHALLHCVGGAGCRPDCGADRGITFLANRVNLKYRAFEPHTHHTRANPESRLSR